MKKTRSGVSNGVCLVSCKVFLACVLLNAVAQLYATPPRLHVEGNKVKDPNGNIVVLRGVSMIDLGSQERWYGGATALIDRITDLNDSEGDSPGWYTKIIRIPVCPADSPSVQSPFTFDPNDANGNFYNNLLRPVVDYCAQKGVYAVIDWHYNANTYDHAADTNVFWAYMAPRFANDTHVIFEIFCEPINQVGTDAANWASVKSDMETWISTIRASAPDNLLFVGTPRYCQIIGPTATNPVSDTNVVYTTHIYPVHWLSTSNQYYVSTITTAALAHPVIMGEWGFESSSNPNDYITNGTISNYGQPLKAFVEGIGIGNMAWVASYNWGPPMFDDNSNPTDPSKWTLHVGPNEMGGFTKDWLYEASGVTQNIDLNITKCNVTAGKTQGRDSNDINNIKDAFGASGTFASSPLLLSGVTQIDVNIVSLADGNIIYHETIGFDFSKVVKSNYKYTPPKGTKRGITSLTMNFSKQTFAIQAQNVDLTGLGCPLRLDITMGNYILTGDANESIVNGPKTLIPTRLMRLYKDTLVVNKAKAKHNSKALSDTLSVTGDIAVIDPDVNLCNYDVNFVWGAQMFSVPPNSFKASKTGHLYKCSKVVADANGNPGVVTAQVDIDKATFTLSVNKANAIDAASNPIPFGISFANFNEAVDVNRVTGRSW